MQNPTYRMSSINQKDLEFYTFRICIFTIGFTGWSKFVKWAIMQTVDLTPHSTQWRHWLLTYATGTPLPHPTDMRVLDPRFTFTVTTTTTRRDTHYKTATPHNNAPPYVLSKMLPYLLFEFFSEVWLDLYNEVIEKNKDWLFVFLCEKF